MFGFRVKKEIEPGHLIAAFSLVVSMGVLWLGWQNDRRQMRDVQALAVSLESEGKTREVNEAKRIAELKALSGVTNAFAQGQIATVLWYNSAHSVRETELASLLKLMAIALTSDERMPQKDRELLLSLCRQTDEHFTRQSTLDAEQLVRFKVNERRFQEAIAELATQNLPTEAFNERLQIIRQQILADDALAAAAFRQNPKPFHDVLLRAQKLVGTAPDQGPSPK